jgi:hypothetical protein
MNPFKGTRRIYWLAGITLLVLGVLGSALILPSISKTPGADGPDVQLPKMENVPPPHAPNKMRFGD